MPSVLPPNIRRLRRMQAMRRVRLWFLAFVCGASLALAIIGGSLYLSAWAEAMGCLDPECILPVDEPATEQLQRGEWIEVTHHQED